MRFKAGLIAAVLVIAILGSITWLSYVRASRLGKVQTFHYQLQGYAPDFVIKHAHDHGTLFVIDGSRFGHDEVEKLKNQGRNTVLAALSVVDSGSGQYWAPEWQKGVTDSVVRMAEAGFDGVYLLGTDAYQHHADRPTAARDMVEWVGRVASAGRRNNRRFIVMPQNVACITDIANFPGVDEKEYTGLNSLYLASIDGVSVEFGTDPDLLRCVQALQNHHKRVFGYTAVTDPGAQAHLLDEMSGHGITGTILKR